MKTACPTCGADVEFRFDDSFVRVCGHCRSAVARTDRGVETLGRVADLVPMESPLRLFAEGKLDAQGFLLIGMAQLRQQGGGLAQEWYAKLDGGQWGWLAEAQGHYYLTFETEAPELPAFDQLAPGATVALAAGTFTVGELGRATYVAANGEMPFRFVPGTTYRFADLSDGQGQFATIDYGDGDDTPTLYVGRQTTIAALHLRGGEVGPSRDKSIASKALACPNCNAPIELRAPEQAQRVVCSSCNELIELTGGTVLSLLGKLATKAISSIPLGTKGKFVDGELTVIGYVQRSAQIDGTWYPFYEYLLYAPEVGFRWLVQSDGHWSYVQPIAIGAVTDQVGHVSYDGVKFRSFQAAPLRVDEVLGEFYWQVATGEMVQSEDWIAPPAMISRESTGSEDTFSLSTYMTAAEVHAAFGRDLDLGTRIGVGANQPDPSRGIANPLMLAFGVLIALGIVFAARASERLVSVMKIEVPPAAAAVAPAPDATAPAELPGNITFSEPFALRSTENIEIKFHANLSNDWAYVAADLVNESTGQVASVDGAMESYSGVDDGESWSEGSTTSRHVIGPMPGGSYVLRVEAQHGGAATNVTLDVGVYQDVYRGKYLGYACLVLGFPLLGFGIYTWSFERKRWDNSSSGKAGAPKTPLTLVIAAIAIVLGGIVVLVKAFGESSSGD